MTKNKTRILHLIKSLGRGGAEKLIPETAALHDRERYSFFCLYFYHRPHNLKGELEQAGIQVEYFPSSNLGLPFQVNRVAEFIRKNGIDIIHCHLPWAGVLGRWVGKKTGVPVVYTEHNMWERYNFLSCWLNKETFGLQHTVVPVSDEVKDSIQKRFLPNGHSPVIKTISNGINTEAFQRDPLPGNSIREALGIPEDSPVIGQVAVFRAQKRLVHWVDIAKAVYNHDPKVHFILVGDGTEMSRVKRRIGDGPFKENIHMVGTKKNVIPYLSAMDIYMITSEFEGLPIAMLEGMACGLPVLSTRAGGIAEVVREGKEGYLCPVSGPMNLVPAALVLVKDPQKCREMGKRARQRVQGHFCMKRMVNELEKVYSSVLLCFQMDKN